MFFVTVERVTMNGLPLNRKRVFVAARAWNTLPVGSFQMVDRGARAFYREHCFLSLMHRLFSLFTPQKPTSPILRSYGQEVSGIAPPIMQKVIEWLALSLIQAGYFGKAHLFWLDAEDDPDVMRVLKRVAHQQQPVFLYRCADRVPAPPQGYYWRMMTEHPSLRVYQLERREAD